MSRDGVFAVVERCLYAGGALLSRVAPGVWAACAIGFGSAPLVAARIVEEIG